MKYILKKDLPLAKAGTEVELNPTPNSNEYCNIISTKDILVSVIHKEDILEWLEEVKEVKTIYDLSFGDTYYLLCANGKINEYTVPVNNPYFIENRDELNCFLTKREAKRNKLLRELATRTDKWLPENYQEYFSFDMVKNCSKTAWIGDNIDFSDYHMGIVFRNEEEYNKYITPEAKDLLFKP